MKKQLPKGNRGRPFKPGSDPRRHLAGRKCRDAIAFSQEFSRVLAERGDPVALAALLWRRALAGRPWAIEIILDRLMGKPTMAVKVSPPLPSTNIVYSDGSLAAHIPGEIETAYWEQKWRNREEGHEAKEIHLDIKVDENGDPVRRKEHDTPKK
jgi:hypothetical protein